MSQSCLSVCPSVCPHICSHQLSKRSEPNMKDDFLKLRNLIFSIFKTAPSSPGFSKYWFYRSSTDEVCLRLPIFAQQVLFFCAHLSFSMSFIFCWTVTSAGEKVVVEDYFCFRTRGTGAGQIPKFSWHLQGFIQWQFEWDNRSILNIPGQLVNLPHKIRPKSQNLSVFHSLEEVKRLESTHPSAWSQVFTYQASQF